SAKTYRGDLARPIRPVTAEDSIKLMLVAGQNGIAQSFAELKANRLNVKVPLLFRHYGIKEGDWRALALALAVRHVPGFAQAKNRSGPKRLWTPYERALLRLEIDTVRDERRCSFDDAVAVVLGRGHWKRHGTQHAALKDQARRAPQNIIEAI